MPRRRPRRRRERRWDRANFRTSGCQARPRVPPTSLRTVRQRLRRQASRAHPLRIRRRRRQRPRRTVARATPRALPSRSWATVTAEPTSLPPTGQAAPAPSSPTSLLPTASSNTLPAPISSGETAVSDRHLSFWPWLAAAIALSGGGLFLWLRRRPREAFAGVPSLQPFEAPLPAPAEPPLPRAPAPEPQARRATPEAPRPARPASPGIVASRLRPLAGSRRPSAALHAQRFRSGHRV